MSNNVTGIHTMKNLSWIERYDGNFIECERKAQAVRGARNSTPNVMREVEDTIEDISGLRNRVQDVMSQVVCESCECDRRKCPAWSGVWNNSEVLDPAIRKSGW